MPFAIEVDSSSVSLFNIFLVTAIHSGKPFPKHFRGVILGGDSSPRAIIEEALNYGVPIYKTYGIVIVYYL